MLLIFTNGNPAEPEKTVSTLDEVDGAPLSIVFVGVGDGDFSSIRELEGRSKSGSCRDNVRYVDYKALKDDKDKLTEAALDHIPDQLVTYFVGKEILPNPKPEPSEISVQPFSEGDDIQVPIQITETGQAVVTGDAKPPEQDNSYSARASVMMSGYGKQAYTYGKRVINLAAKRKIGMIKRQLLTQVNKAIRPWLGFDLFPTRTGRPGRRRQGRRY